MAILALRDKATRHGTLDSPEYVSKLNALAQVSKTLRGKFGDAVYDRYLYAVGMPNRVLVTDVYPESAAADIGIVAGDVVMKYASRYIFSMRDLQTATVTGTDGNPVLIEWQRNGISMSATVPRGPLGVDMEEVTQAPEMRPGCGRTCDQY